MAQEIVVDIERDDSLALSIKKELREHLYQYHSYNTEREVTIFRLPLHVRERNKNAYEPRIVSIGPYHKRREDLKCMEEQKLRYLGQMLYENPDTALENYLEVLQKLEPAARRCYYENIEMDSDEFVKMLLYDACFIIQLAVNWSFPNPNGDIVPSVSWNVPLIRTDLLMLENQIPFFVLQHVFDLYSSREDDTPNLIPPSNGDSEGFEFANASLSEHSEPEKATLIDVLVCFLQWRDMELWHPEKHNDYAHLLHFYYHCYISAQELPTKRRKKFLAFETLGLKKASSLISSIEKKLTTCKRVPMRPCLKKKRKPRTIPCATELQEKGITLKEAETKSIFGVQFSHGVLRIPCTFLEEATRAHIMNLIAFENCSGQKDRPVTSYAKFMTCILKTPRDVLILRRNGIIGNKLDNEKVVVELVKDITSFAYLDYERHHLAELFEDVNNCRNYRWKKYITDLWENYFRSPWSIISFIAAIALLIFTFLQTLYTVMSYYRSP